MTVADKLARPGPRKLLALDGGGIRGLITIEVLAEMERCSARSPARATSSCSPTTSTTSPERAPARSSPPCLSVGMRVKQIRDFYVENAARHVRQGGLLRRFRFKYENDRWRRGCDGELGEDTTLGSDRLRTLLLIVMRNATTDSPWPLSNNPHALYNDPTRVPAATCDIPLWQLVRASTAAPTYFPPEVIDVGGGRRSFSSTAA